MIRQGRCWWSSVGGEHEINHLKSYVPFLGTAPPLGVGRLSLVDEEDAVTRLVQGMELALDEEARFQPPRGAQWCYIRVNDFLKGENLLCSTE